MPQGSDLCRDDSPMEMHGEINRLHCEERAVEQARQTLRDALAEARGIVSAVPEFLSETETETGIDVSPLREARTAWADMPDIATAWADTLDTAATQTDTPDTATALADHLESACLPLLEAAETVCDHAAVARERLRLQ